jgi:hypothetical protein
MTLGGKFKNIVEKAVSGRIVATQKDFANLLGIHEASLYRLFTMDSIKTKHIKKACEIVKISVEEFFREEHPESLIADPQEVYLTKSQQLKIQLDEQQHTIEKLQNENAGLREQLKLKDQIIELMQQQKRSPK